MHSTYLPSLFLALLLSILAGTEAGTGAVVINELMINEPGSEVALEWIELHNAGEEILDLSDYILLDGADTTWFGDSTSLFPGSYLVVSRKPVGELGESSFESRWGNSSGVWGDDAAEGFRLLSGDFSLKNSSDSIKLTCLISDEVEVIRWFTSPPDGVSVERINPYRPPEEANFDYSRDETGCTPGEVNSVLPHEHDLALVEDNCGVTIDGNRVAVDVAVKNVGLRTSTGSQAIVYFDRDFSGDLSVPDDVDSVAIPVLEVDSTLTTEKSYIETDGRKRLGMLLATDDNEDNNSLLLEFPVGDLFLELQINELMLDTSSAAKCQWLELLNMTDYAVNLQGFGMGSHDQVAVIDSDIVVEPAAFVILCEDCHALADYYGALSCACIEPEQWVTFPEGEGTLLFKNDLDRYSDTLHYAIPCTAGISWERRPDSAGVSRASYFYCSTSPIGATPGFPNSDPPTLPEFELGFTADTLIVVLPSATGSVGLQSEVCNNGAAIIEQATLQYFLDEDFSGSIAVNELMDIEQIESLEPGQCVTVEHEINAGAGHFRVICVLPPDFDSADNRATASFSVGPETHETIVTEFIADPEGSLECEWVECRNVSRRHINLEDWQFGDYNHSHRLPASMSIAPEEYFVVAEDSLEFVSYYGEGCLVVEPSGWSSLNNSGDCIRLIDAWGVSADTVIYVCGNGGNRSLELNEYADEAEQWYPSTSASGATPCRANAVSGRSYDRIEVQLLSKVFSPSEGEVLRYRLMLPPATTLSIEVYDLAGRRHYTIADARSFSSGIYEYDGSSDYYSRLPVGAYIMKIEADDGSGFSTRVGFAVAGPR